ncbi:MAG: hypothetical protein GX877_01595 [Bacteroidales bacterium]|nr:hypothetical protein [Bacteroidales bacterium]
MAHFPVEKHADSVVAVEQALHQWMEQHEPEFENSVQLVYRLEIEFYLTDRFMYQSRPDLLLCGRTLQGLSPSKHLYPHTPGYPLIPYSAEAFIAEVQETAEEEGMIITFSGGKGVPTQLAVILDVDNAANAPKERQNLLKILLSPEDDQGIKVLLHPRPFAGFPASAQYCHWSLMADGAPLTTPIRFPLECTGTLLHFNRLAAEFIQEHTGTFNQMIVSLAETAATLHCAASKDVPAEVQTYREQENVMQLEREVHVLSQMTINHFVPAAVRHQNLLLKNIQGLKEAFPEETFKELASTQFKAVEITARYVNELRNLVHQLLDAWNGPKTTKEEIPALMEEIRKRADHLEMIVDHSLWQLPKYKDLFYLR